LPLDGAFDVTFFPVREEYRLRGGVVICPRERWGERVSLMRKRPDSLRKINRDKWLEGEGES